MHQVRERGGMEKTSKAQVRVFLGFEGGSFKYLDKLFENRISLRGDRKGGRGQGHEAEE